MDDKQKTFEWGVYVLSMRNIHPKSRLWRMRAKQVLAKLEEQYGKYEVLRTMQAESKLSKKQRLPIRGVSAREVRNLPET